MGFMSRVQTEQVLMQQSRSTLLIKVSDNQFGCLIISYIKPGGTEWRGGGMGTFNGCLSFSSSSLDRPQHLSVTSANLATVAFDRCIEVNDLHGIELIYPDISIQAFKIASNAAAAASGRETPGGDPRGTPASTIDPYARSMSIGFQVEGLSTLSRTTTPLNTWDALPAPENW